MRHLPMQNCGQNDKLEIGRVSQVSSIKHQHILLDLENFEMTPLVSEFYIGSLFLAEVRQPVPYPSHGHLTVPNVLMWC